MTLSERTVEFECQVTGDPAPKVAWRKLQGPLPDHRIQILEDHTLRQVLGYFERVWGIFKEFRGIFKGEITNITILGDFYGGGREGMRVFSFLLVV